MNSPPNWVNSTSICYNFSHLYLSNSSPNNAKAEKGFRNMTELLLLNMAVDSGSGICCLM